jgi:hypothetical protein
MYVKDALRVYKSRSEIARILEGIRHRSAIYQWDEEGLVPLGAAVVLAQKSPDPSLKVRAQLYERKRQERMSKAYDMRQRKKMLETIRKGAKIK